MAASGALLTVGALVFTTVPDPAFDPLLGEMLKVVAPLNPTTGLREYPVAGGVAYPRIKAGTFGSIFTLPERADVFKVSDDPRFYADGKFFVIKAPPDSLVKPVPDEEGNINAENLIAIYQVCVHLGCLVPYIPSEKRFICPCHGSIYERNTQYVSGPAPRNLDQFPVRVVNGSVIVNTGRRVFGQMHA
jgi:cytochrome b6-f complex iron-sulfur subunit